MAVYTTGENGNSDEILPYYIQQATEAYHSAVAPIPGKHVILIIDPLFDTGRQLLETHFNRDELPQLIASAREDHLPSMAVIAVHTIAAKVVLHDIVGASQIIDSINATDYFAIFIMDGMGERWFNCPVNEHYS